MRAYVLTKKEVQIINRYLQNRERLEGFAVLLSRCRQAIQPLEGQLTLIKTFIETVENP